MSHAAEGALDTTSRMLCMAKHARADSRPSSDLDRILHSPFTPHPASARGPCLQQLGLWAGHTHAMHGHQHKHKIPQSTPGLSWKSVTWGRRDPLGRASRRPTTHSEMGCVASWDSAIAAFRASSSLPPWEIHSRGSSAAGHHRVSSPLAEAVSILACRIHLHLFLHSAQASSERFTYSTGSPSSLCPPGLDG